MQRAPGESNEDVRHRHVHNVATRLQFSANTTHEHQCHCALLLKTLVVTIMSKVVCRLSPRLCFLVELSR